MKTRKLQPALEEFKPARSVGLTDDERAIAKNFFLLTTKPTIYAANVNEAALSAADENEHVKAVREIAKVFRKHVDQETLEKVVDDLLDIRGDKSFRDMIGTLARELKARF